MTDTRPLLRLAELMAEGMDAETLLARLEGDAQAPESTLLPDPPAGSGKRDSEGFYRVTRRGRNVWWTRRQAGGVRRELTAATKGELREKVKAFDERYASAGTRRKRKSIKTLGDGRDIYLELYTGRAQSKDTLEARLKAILDTPVPGRDGRTLAEMAPHETDKDDVTRIFLSFERVPRPTTGRPYTPNTLRGLAKSGRQFGAWLFEDGYDEENIFSKIQMPEMVKDVDPYESWAQVQLLAATFVGMERPDYGQLVRFVTSTGLSPQEWMVARECDLNRRDGTFTVSRTWTEAGEVEYAKEDCRCATILIPDLGLEVVEELPISLHRDPKEWWNSPLLFPEYGDPSKVIDLHAFRRKRGEGGKQPGIWTLAHELAGIRRRPPKQMRHTLAYLALTGDGNPESQVPLEDVSKMLRHDSTTTTETYYLKIVPQMARRSIEQMNLGTTRFSLRAVK